MERILVLGASGAGKSTLARILAEELDLPLIHLDREFWLPGYIKPDPDEWHDRVRQMAAADRWVMDGNYLDTIECRLARAQALVWLDVPRWLYMTRLIWRKVRYYGRERADLGPGLPERFNRAHIARAYAYPGVGHLRLKHAVELALAENKPVYQLTSRDEIRQFSREVRAVANVSSKDITFRNRKASREREALGFEHVSENNLKGSDGLNERDVCPGAKCAE